MRECMTQVRDLLKAKIQCIWIDTYEESAVINDLREILSAHIIGMNLQVWSFTEGLKRIPMTTRETQEKANPAMMNPKALFDHIRDVQEAKADEGRQDISNVFVLRDFHLLNEKIEIKRSIRDLKEYKSTNYNPIIVISPTASIPMELQKLFSVVTFETPDRAEIETTIAGMSRQIAQAVSRGKDLTAPTPEEQRQLINAALGLTANELSDVLAKSLTKYRCLSPQAVMDEKIQLVRKSGVLDYVVPKFTMDDIGGNQAFKDWAMELRNSYTEEAKEFGIAPPKGYMAFGIPGSSKTVSVEAFAGMMNYPLLVLSIGRIMDKRVGESENRIDQACRVAKACAPCVLMIDEVEKVLGGAQVSNQTDSGITNRVLARLLELLNDDDSGVVVIMTSNDVSQLPPEFTRSGRLDAQWYFGLPTVDERKDIFRIHFGKVNRTVSPEVIDAAAKAANNYTGAEIKEVVKVAMRKAYVRFREDGNRELTAEDVISAVKDVIPLYASSQERIHALEMYARGRARNTNYVDNSDLNDSDDSQLVADILELGGGQQ